MAAVEGIKLEGFTQFQRSLKKADKSTRLGIRKIERQVAEPIRVDAQQLATREIRNIGNVWSRMRVGITTKVVYVAPKTRRKVGKPRPNLAGLLLTKAMQPALETNRAQFEVDVKRMLERIEVDFNRGGV